MLFLDLRLKVQKTAEKEKIPKQKSKQTDPFVDLHHPVINMSAPAAVQHIIHQYKSAGEGQNEIKTIKATPGDEQYDLAQYDSKDVKFVARLEHIEIMEYANEDGYLLHFKIDFMGSFDNRSRIQAADLEIQVSPLAKSASEQEGESKGSALSNRQQPPRFTVVKPEVQFANMSDREVTISGKKSLAVAANGSGFGSATIGMERGVRGNIKFKGVTTIHGVIKHGSDKVCWRIHEDPASKSGVPPRVRLVAAVRAKDGFLIRVIRFDAKVYNRRRFWKLNSLSADASLNVEVGDINEVIDQIFLFKSKKASELLEKSTKVATLARTALDSLQAEAAATVNKIAPMDLAIHGEHLEHDLRLLQDIAKACQDWREDPLKGTNVLNRCLHFDELLNRILMKEQFDEGEQEDEKERQAHQKSKVQDAVIQKQLHAVMEELRKTMDRVKLARTKDVISTLDCKLLEFYNVAKVESQQDGNKDNADAAEKKSHVDSLGELLDLCSEAEKMMDNYYLDKRWRRPTVMTREAAEFEWDHHRRGRQPERSPSLEYMDVSPHRHLSRSRHRVSQWVPPEPGMMSSRGRVRPEELNDFSAVSGYSMTVFG